MIKRLFSAFFVCLIVFSLICMAQIREKKARLILATATTGGTYYPVGVAISTLTTTQLEKTDNILMTAITSAGSGENIQLLKNGEADLAIIQSLNGEMARQGKGRYEDDPQPFLRSISVLWENVEHFVILKKFEDSGNMSDLKNIRKKNFSIGRRGSGTEISGREILKSLGYSLEKDFRFSFLGYAPSANALQNGRIVGMNIPAGPPASAITQAYAAIGEKKLCILEFTENQVKSVNAVFPVWKRYVIPEETYPGQKESIQTISQPNLLVTHRDLPDEVVYMIVKTMYENLDYLQKIHQATQVMSLDSAFSGLSIPLHPGAVRYYEEQGLIIPAKLK
ncbi:TAXI family TRAP transporter solute-binding subunit [Acidobacteriota bacterium]